MLRCASSFVIAAYEKCTPHSSRFARLACGAFYEAVEFGLFFDFLRVHKSCHVVKKNDDETGKAGIFQAYADPED